MSKVKCYNCDKKGHCARDCTELKKVTFSTKSPHINVCAHVLVPNTSSGWIVDTRATKHVTRDRVGFVDYHQIPKGTSGVFMGDGCCIEALGVGSYELQMLNGRTLLLNNIFYVLGIQLNLFSVLECLVMDIVLSFLWLDVLLDRTIVGHGFFKE